MVPRLRPFVLILVTKGFYYAIGCDYMFKLGILFFIAGAIFVFGSNILFKRGKITTLESLLRTKLIGLGLTIVATILMIFGK